MELTQADYLPKEVEFNDLVMEWNKKINLVSRKKENVFDLIDDSRKFLDHIEFTDNPYILDLGTGGGFPGIVIKIHQPKAKIVLVDSIMKKVTAVCDIAARLKIGKLNAICSRAEDIAKNNMFKHTFDYVVARSVAPLQDLVKWCHGLIKPEGKLLTLKGADIGAEIEKACNSKYVKKIEYFERENKIIVQVKFNII